MQSTETIMGNAIELLLIIYDASPKIVDALLMLIF